MSQRYLGLVGCRPGFGAIRLRTGVTVSNVLLRYRHFFSRAKSYSVELLLMSACCSVILTVLILRFDANISLAQLTYFF